MKKGILLSVLFCSFSLILFAQNVAINADGTNPDASAMLDVKSNNKGFLTPRMTQSERNAIPLPAAGLMIYQTDNSPGFYYYSGISWGAVVPNTLWKLNGNTGTNPATNFIGTADRQALVFKVNNEKAGLIDVPSEFTNDGPSITALGYQALNSNTGRYSTAFGYQALFYNTTAWYNTAVGYRSLFRNTSGISNTGIGQSSLESNETGNNNTATGRYALKNTTSSDNTANGFQSLGNNQTGSGNTAVGSSTFGLNTIGNNNTALGFSANVSANNLSNATVIGSGAIVTASNSVQLGNAAVTNVYAGVGTTATVVTGGLKVTGGSLAPGKVLTSDALGVATWQTPSGSSGWSLTGNTGINPETNFIGTTDAMPLNFKVNGVIAGRIDPYYSIGNTFLGGSAGLHHSNTIGEWNSAFGRGALYNNFTGLENVSIGVSSLFYHLGSRGTAVGYEALAYFPDAEGSVAVGHRALRGIPIPANNTGLLNTAIGANSLIDNTSGGNNTASGYAALFTNTTGSNNTATGNNALTTNTTGSNNTAVGSGADVSSGTLINTTAIGSGAIVTENNTVQLGDVAVTKVYAGVGTTATVVTGGLQVTGGSLAPGNVLTSNASGVATWQMPSGSSGWSLTGNTGTNPATNFIGTNDVASLNFRANGAIAGRIDPYYTSGNTFLGGSAGISNTTGFFNAAFGRGALHFNVSGSSNTTIGVNSLFHNVDGNGGTAVGFEAMAYYLNPEGSVAVGAQALRGYPIPSINTGLKNTAIGVTTLIDNTSGGNNTASGYQALFTNNSGSNNTATGSNALTTNTSGSNNTAIGKGADVATGSLNNATAIGGGAIVNASNTVQIGNSSVTDVYFGNPATTVLHANSVVPSDARFKYNVKNNVPGLDFIKRLRPVTYYFDEQKLAEFTRTGLITNSYIKPASYSGEKQLHTGFLAQDVEKTANELGYNFDGVRVPVNDKDHYSLAYSQFIMPLVKAVQEQQLQIDELKKENKELMKLKAEVEKLTKFVQEIVSTK